MFFLPVVKFVCETVFLLFFLFVTGNFKMDTSGLVILVLTSGNVVLSEHQQPSQRCCAPGELDFRICRKYGPIDVSMRKLL